VNHLKNSAIWSLGLALMLRLNQDLSTVNPDIESFREFARKKPEMNKLLGGL
jgi:hypothetical protein